MNTMSQKQRNINSKYVRCNLELFTEEKALTVESTNQERTPLDSHSLIKTTII